MSIVVPKRDAEADSAEFVVFSDDWGEHPSSSQHLFARIAESHRVTWINTVGMRSPTLSASDLKKGVRKIARMALAFRTDQGYGSNKPLVTVYRPLMMPFSTYKAVRRFNAWSVSRRVAKVLRDHSPRSAVIVTTVPNVGDYCDSFGSNKLIYYCVDDFTLWPGFEAALIREMESRLIARADLLIAASDELAERLRVYKKPTFILTHGVDLEMFARLAPVLHPSLSHIPHPRAGFFGLIDGRMDHELVATLAKRMPSWSFVLAGPVDPTGVRISAEKNVHYIGPVPYRELPALIAGLRVLMLPYREGGLAESLSPLKLKEYLATGKRIVSSPIAEARKWASFVTLASTIDEWCEGLSSSCGLDSDERKSDVMRALAVESWESKALQFLSMCGCAPAALREGA